MDLLRIFVIDDNLVVDQVWHFVKCKMYMFCSDVAYRKQSKISRDILGCLAEDSDYR